MWHVGSANNALITKFHDRALPKLAFHLLEGHFKCTAAVWPRTVQTFVRKCSRAQRRTQRNLTICTRAVVDTAT